MLTQDGQPATCDQLHITSMTIEARGPGHSHCGTEARSCHGDTYVVDCRAGSFSEAFVGGSESDEYSFMLQFQRADHPEGKIVVQSSSFDQGDRLPFTVDFAN